ncbi:hypothetical protein Clacol_005209 [Clathrus columnatus]|uniref:Glycosyltransferase family 1 protein n=1 Tax=Clathrus columnatus TaxID=1419009 RepID=A0AAV5A9H0_9AGAM|nr:hypothetical protein Clacol_005209 [Clathrus columnatus]
MLSVGVVIILRSITKTVTVTYSFLLELKLELRESSSSKSCTVDVSDKFVLHSLGLNLIKDEKADTRIWCWSSTSIFALLSIVLPGYLSDKAREFTEKREKSICEAPLKPLAQAIPNDKLTELPGLPKAYVYELVGQHNVPGSIERWADFVVQLTNFIYQSHGLLLANNTPIIEEGGVTFTKEWLSSKGCYALGPSMLPGEAKFHSEESLRGQEQEVITFLDKVYDSHGKNSLLYMSFGSAAFPNGDTPWQLIEIILDMKIPFVRETISSGKHYLCNLPWSQIFTMPHGVTSINTLPPELGSKLESSELALVTKWAPQRTILDHPVTGIFFTHGGQGSITESSSLGVPMIIWPCQGDQPYNALNLTINLKVAYQLVEVRIGHGLKPLYRGYKPIGTKEAIDTEFRQVLKNAFGSDGDAKRETALEISKRLRETWEEGGGAMIELRRMLQENFS